MAELPQKHRVSVSGVLKILGVSRSGYRAWKQRVPSVSEKHRDHIKDAIKQIYDGSHQNYGAPKITEMLHRQGESIAEKTVGNYMRQMGIKAQWVKPYTVTTIDSDFNSELQNILDEQFNPSRPDAVWVSDITYIWTYNGFVYLTSIMDLYSRKIIAWVLSQSLEAVTKYFVPDNLRTAVTKHTKDELILQSTFADLEDFYETIVLPPPARKPKGKPTVENHVRYLEIHLVEKLKEKIYVSFEDLNAEIKKIVAVLNKRSFQGKDFSRQDAFEKHDKPCMKPLPGGCYTACDYKAVLKVPNNYHIEYDGHYYSVLYSYCGKPAILKATASEIRICDQYNRLICTHKRSYREFPLYITVDEHMPPEHLYYKEVNSKDGNYYRRWASAIGPAMSELIDRLLKSSKHEEQSYNACAGILHKVKTIPKGAAEEVARKCIEINSCKYFTFKQMLKKMDVKELPEHSPGTLPNHENIRGKDYYK